MKQKKYNEQRGHVLVFVVSCLFICVCFTKETHLFIYVWVLQMRYSRIMLNYLTFLL